MVQLLTTHPSVSKAAMGFHDDIKKYYILNERPFLSYKEWFVEKFEKEFNCKFKKKNGKEYIIFERDLELTMFLMKYS